MIFFIRNLILSVVVITMLSSCTSLLEEEPDTSLLYDVNISAELEESCLGPRLDLEHLSFQVLDEKVEFQEYEDQLSGRVSRVNYRCSWRIGESDAGGSYLRSLLSVWIRDTGAYEKYDTDHPEIAGRVIIDSLDGWDSGYCALIANSGVGESEEGKTGYECKARSSNMELVVEVHVQDEIDLKDLMGELSPLVHQAFEKL